MTAQPDISDLIQCHKGIQFFEYDLTVDWAIDLIGKGMETDNIFMLASFSKPVDSREIVSYVSTVLRDLGIEEKEGDAAVIGKAYYHLRLILCDQAIRKNLDALYTLCLHVDHRHGLTIFYMIYMGWENLEGIGGNYYSEGNDPASIEAELKREARTWINEYVHSL